MKAGSSISWPSALFLLILEFLIPERKSKWADKIKLFNR